MQGTGTGLPMAMNLVGSTEKDYEVPEGGNVWHEYARYGGKIQKSGNGLQMAWNLVPTLKNRRKPCFLIADTQLYERLVRPSVGLSIRWSMVTKSKSGKTSVNTFYVYLCVNGGVRVWMRVEYPCPPVRNDIVTPHHLLDKVLRTDRPRRRTG